MKSPTPAPVQEIPIRPMVVKLPPERIIERTFVEREPHTEPLAVPPIVNIEVPPAQAPHVTVVNVQPERTRNEPRTDVSREDTLPDGPTDAETERIASPETNISPVAQPPVEQPEPEQKTLALEPEKCSPDEQKNVPSANKKRSENNSPNNSETIPSRIDDELFTPDTPASQADLPEFEKIGPGRQRRYEELGKDDVEPIRELVLFRHQFGRHWPGLSRDMETYYERFYFTPPNKRKDGKDHDKHVKCWERRTKWLATTESASGSR